MTGKLEDGERLIEDRIATELKTSRGPVREALRQLEHEGFVVSYPYIDEDGAERQAHETCTYLVKQLA